MNQPEVNPPRVDQSDVNQPDTNRWLNLFKQKVSFFDSILWLFPFYFVLAFMFIVFMGIVHILLYVSRMFTLPKLIEDNIEYLIAIFSACLLIHFIYSFFTFSLKQWKKKPNISEIEEVGDCINKRNVENKNPTS